VTSSLEVIYNEMCCINLRFTYLLTDGQVAERYVYFFRGPIHIIVAFEILLDQEMVSYGCSSCCCCSCCGDLLKTAKGSVFSNRIGIKFGTIVLRYVRIDWRSRIFDLTATMTSFHTEKCRRLASKHEASAGAAAPARFS